MALQLITGPAAEPISADELKLQARVEGSTEDALLSVYIKAARRQCESLTQRALITQTWELLLDEFPACSIKLGRAPALSVVSVKYLDATTGTLTTLDPSSYSVDIATPGGRIRPINSWPATADRPNAVQVRFTAGYGATSADVPEDLRSWVLLTAAYLYAQREAIDTSGKASALPGRFYDALLDDYRSHSA